jgi:hypothetical protein
MIKTYDMISARQADPSGSAEMGGKILGQKSKRKECLIEN